MKIYILTDMEGLAGAYEWAHVKVGEPWYPIYQQELAAEVNAAVSGAFAGGATQVVINDGHSTGCNLILHQCHPRAEYERPVSSERVLPSIDESFAAMLLVGYHSRIGTPTGVLCHTQNHNDWAGYWANGIELGEIGQMALIAGHYQVPVALVTGDQAATDEARNLLGDIETVAVKTGFTPHRCRSLHPQEACRLIEAGAKRAVERAAARAFRPYRLPTPLRLEIEFFTPEAAATRAQAYPDTERLSPTRIARTVPEACLALGI